MTERDRILAKFPKHYFENFPAIGTGTMFDRIMVGQTAFAVMIEAKVELSVNMGFVLLLVNPALKMPLYPFEIQIPLATLKKGQYSLSDGRFNVQLLQDDVLDGLGHDTLKSTIAPETKTGTWGPETNEWVDSVYRRKTNKDRIMMIQDFVWTYIAKEKVKAGVKPMKPDFETIIKVIERTH